VVGFLVGVGTFTVLGFTVCTFVLLDVVTGFGVGVGFFVVGAGWGVVFFVVTFGGVGVGILTVVGFTVLVVVPRVGWVGGFCPGLVGHG